MDLKLIYFHSIINLKIDNYIVYVIIFLMLFWSCKVEEFSILEIKVKDLLGRYETILSEHKALAENITFLNRVKLELETKINSFKEEKTILEADKRNIADNLNILKL